jgi:hypothetical protein
VRFGSEDKNMYGNLIVYEYVYINICVCSFVFDPFFSPEMESRVCVCVCVCARAFVCVVLKNTIYEGVSKSFRTGRLEPELQMVQLSAIRCNCIVIL